jgi:hypothetical protein
LTIASTAALGPRDVTVTNPDGQSVVRSAGFAVAPPSPTLSLAFVGKARDKVGAGSAAFTADGALDGSFRVSLVSGSGARTVTRLELRRSVGGMWDTDATTPHWALGAAASLDGALLNASGGAVNFVVADGGAFFVFAADQNPTLFGTGASFTVTASFADGTTAAASATVPPLPAITGVTPGSGGPGASLTVTVTGANFQTGASAVFGAGITINSTTVVSTTELSVALTIAPTAALGPRDVTVANPDGTSVIRPGGFAVATMSVAYLGKVRDKVGAGSSAFNADGALDATFQVSMAAGSGPRTVTRLELRRVAGGAWDTDSATPHWALGAAASLDGALLNAAGSGAVNFAVTDGGSFLVFASDLNPSFFTPGTAFSLLVTLVDGSVVTLPTTLP